MKKPFITRQYLQAIRLLGMIFIVLFILNVRFQFLTTQSRSPLPLQVAG